MYCRNTGLGMGIIGGKLGQMLSPYTSYFVCINFSFSLFPLSCDRSSADHADDDDASNTTATAATAPAITTITTTFTTTFNTNTTTTITTILF